MLSSETTDDGGSIGQGNLPGDRRPSVEWRARSRERRGRCGQRSARWRCACPVPLWSRWVVSRSGSRCALGVPGDDGCSMESRVDPGNEAQASISVVQADDARADGVEAHRLFQQWLRERGIMDKGREKTDRRQVSSSRDRAKYARGSRVRAGTDAGPGHDRRQHRGWHGARPGWGTIDDEVARPDQLTPQGGQHVQHEEGLWQGRSGGLNTVVLLGGTGNAWLAITTQRQATGQG